MHGEISPFREVLSQEAVRVLVRAALPGMRRVTEVDLDVRSNGEALVLCHLRPAIPGERFIEFLRQFARMLYECVDDRRAVLAVDLDQHEIARLNHQPYLGHG